MKVTASIIRERQAKLAEINARIDADNYISIIKKRELIAKGYTESDIEALEQKQQKRENKAHRRSHTVQQKMNKLAKYDIERNDGVRHTKEELCLFMQEYFSDWGLESDTLHIIAEEFIKSMSVPLTGDSQRDHNVRNNYYKPFKRKHIDNPKTKHTPYAKLLKTFGPSETELKYPQSTMCKESIYRYNKMFADKLAEVEQTLLNGYGRIFKSKMFFKRYIFPLIENPNFNDKEKRIMLKYLVDNLDDSLIKYLQLNTAFSAEEKMKI